MNYRRVCPICLSRRGEEKVFRDLQELRRHKSECHSY